MLEDKILIWKMKKGSSDALTRIYQKYKKDMFSLANALLCDTNLAEDVTHDVFISFVKSAKKFKLTGSLKGYLLTCIANRSRDKLRRNKRQPLRLDDIKTIPISDYKHPCEKIISSQQLKQVKHALTELPYEQREVVILHIQAARTFKQIAKLQNAPISTIQSRYRYGLEKLRALLKSEAKNETRRQYKKTNS